MVKLIGLLGLLVLCGGCGGSGVRPAVQQNVIKLDDNNYIEMPPAPPDSPSWGNNADIWSKE